jgi:hypothetical protein
MVVVDLTGSTFTGSTVHNFLNSSIGIFCNSATFPSFIYLFGSLLTIPVIKVHLSTHSGLFGATTAD